MLTLYLSVLVDSGTPIDVLYTLRMTALSLFFSSLFHLRKVTPYSDVAQDEGVHETCEVLLTKSPSSVGHSSHYSDGIGRLAYNPRHRVAVASVLVNKHAQDADVCDSGYDVTVSCVDRYFLAIASPFGAGTFLEPVQQQLRLAG